MRRRTNERTLTTIVAPAQPSTCDGKVRVLFFPGCSAECTVVHLELKIHELFTGGPSQNTRQNEIRTRVASMSRIRRPTQGPAGQHQLAHQQATCPQCWYYAILRYPWVALRSREIRYRRMRIALAGSAFSTTIWHVCFRVPCGSTLR